MAGDESDGRLHLVLSYERDGPLPFTLSLLALYVGFAVLLVPIQVSFHEDGLYQVSSSLLLGPVVYAPDNTTFILRIHLLVYKNTERGVLGFWGDRKSVV